MFIRCTTLLNGTMAMVPALLLPVLWLLLITIFYPNGQLLQVMVMGHTRVYTVLMLPTATGTEKFIMKQLQLLVVEKHLMGAMALCGRDLMDLIQDRKYILKIMD